MEAQTQDQTAWVPSLALPPFSQVTLGEATWCLGALVSSSEIGTVVPDSGLLPGLNESIPVQGSDLIISIIDVCSVWLSSGGLCLHFVFFPLVTWQLVGSLFLDQELKLGAGSESMES